MQLAPEVWKKFKMMVDSRLFSPLLESNDATFVFCLIVDAALELFHFSSHALYHLYFVDLLYPVFGIIISFYCVVTAERMFS